MILTLAAPRSPAKHVPREESWALKVRKGVEGSSVYMGNLSMTDDEALQWAAWLDTQKKPQAWKNVDFSGNQLSAAGAVTIIDAVTRVGGDPVELRLYRNCLCDCEILVTALTALLARGVLERLHLSHNRLTPHSVHPLIIQALEREDHPVPVWLRVEGNDTDALGSWSSDPRVCFKGATCTPRRCSMRRCTRVHLPHVENHHKRGEDRSGRDVQGPQVADAASHAHPGRGSAWRSPPSPAVRQEATEEWPKLGTAKKQTALSAGTARADEREAGAARAAASNTENDA